jgi:hypothetical protein
VVSLAGTHKYAKLSLLEFTEPHLNHKVPLLPVKVGVWCAVIARRMVVPVF